ncbi:hypothetical protein N7463_000777 [Penicillium fimorum]|uniref:Uncharacterized protein n=1 Tax=Penicillium fimorum TaxID=1882269 RepID=A0A9W9Y517_9EURO|nr:hypothetical protein N7463_000777 [Penicillium fimorum]
MAFVSDQFFSEMDASISNEWVDFDQFLDLPSDYDDQSTPTTVSPQDLALPYETDEMFTSPSDFMQSSFDMTNYDLSQEEFMGMDGGFMQDPAAPLFDDAAFLGYNPYDSSSTFRNLVEAQAAADPRVATMKEKRREAAIVLHLQRLCDATALDLDMSSDSNTSFSSPSWSEYVRGSTSPHSTSDNISVEAPPPGGMEMVLDLNMNAAANVPKKQKPRSQAQKENYIKARKYGACEKHKKQHKRCNCLEKAAARVAASDVPMNAALQERPRQLMLQVPILPGSRYSDSPGHDPSFNSPQALPTVKATRKPTSISSGLDQSVVLPSMGLPVAAPIAKQIIRTKTQKSTPPGHDIVLLSGKSVFKSTSSQDTALLSSRNIVKGGAAGHDIVLSGKTIANHSVAGHERAPTQDRISKNAGSGQPHDPCISSTPRPAQAAGVSSDRSSLRWRASSSSVGLAYSEKTNTKTTCSVDHPTTGARHTPSLHVYQTSSTRTTEMPLVPGTVSGNVGMRHSIPIVHNSGAQVPGPDRRRVSEGLAKQLAILSGLQSVPKDLLVSPIRRGSPTLPHTLEVWQVWQLLISGGLTVRPITESVGGLLTSTALAFAGAWKSSLSLAAGVEGMVYKSLSLFGRHIMSAKKGLCMGGLRNAWCL